MPTIRVVMRDMPTSDVDRTPRRAPGETAELVLALALRGKNTREIARLCDISTQAANGHLNRLRSSGRLKEKAS